MTKVTSFVLKVASRCNLNCSYCYMYNLGDTTYMDQPKFMAVNTIRALANRLESYSSNAEIRYVQIVFHGGEPLLLDKEYFRTCMEIFREAAPAIDFTFTIQTNGVNLDADWYQFFNEYQVRIGISIDGPRQYHDHYRVFHNGKGSYQQVSTAVKLGRENGLAGILMVMNVHIPAAEFYEELKTLQATNLNLLYPDGHYDKLPEGFDPARFGDENYTPYADWLIALFRIWKMDTQRPRISFFQNLIYLLMGEEQVGNQSVGKRTNGVAVIETNGAVEVADSLRACYEGITRNDVNVHTGHIEDLFSHDIFEVYYNAHEMVCEQCLNCPVYDICGGGFLGNRFSLKNGFDNPTIYCRDIIRLLSFIQNDIIGSLPAEAVSKMELEMLSYHEVLQDFKKPFPLKIDQTVQQKLTAFKQL